MKLALCLSYSKGKEINLCPGFSRQNGSGNIIHGNMKRELMETVGSEAICPGARLESKGRGRRINE